MSSSIASVPGFFDSSVPTSVLPSCVFCGTDSRLRMTMPIDAKTFKTTTHGSIYDCLSCAFGYVHPRPASTDSFYDLEAYYTQGASHMSTVPTALLLDRLRVHLAWRRDRSETLLDVITGAIQRGGSIVDIGCGSGWLLQNLAERGYDVTGVERDTSALSFKNVVQGSAENLPELGTFDGVVFSHVVEHLVNPLAVIKAARALMKPGGKLFVEVPNNESLIARQSRLSWEHLDIPRHLNFFTERSLRRLVAAAGMTVKRSYFGGYCRYFSASYIATEQRIHDQLPAGSASTRNSRTRAWALLARTAFAGPRKKYDSVGVVAQ